MNSSRKIRFGLSAVATVAALTMAAPGPQAKDLVPVKVEKPQAWKGVQQVVIGQFSVAFFTKKVDYDGGGFLSGNGKGKAIGHLSGLGNDQYQAITDAVYGDFVAQLGRHGVTIASDAGLTANKYFAKVKPEAQANTVDVLLNKSDHADALAFWPTALRRNTNVLLNLRLMDSNMVNAYTAEYDYAKTSGVPVINVVYYVDFAKPAKSEAGGLLQSIKVAAGLAISQFGTQVAMMGTDGKMTKMLLQMPLEEGGDFAAIEETTSALTKATRVAGILGAGVFGGSAGGMSARFDYKVTDPAAYGNGVKSASTKASDLFIRQMEGLR